MVQNVFIRTLLFLVILMSTLSCDFNAEAFATPKPSLYDINKLNELRNNRIDDPQVVKFLREAYIIRKEPLLTVVGKPHTYSTNPHDYCSIARYSWPDENNPDGPYVYKDGQSNPEIKLYDRPKLEKLANRLQILSVAYYITGDQTFYDAFIKNVKTWFIDKETYMEPNFEYAQVEKGHNYNKGQSYGLCEMEEFAPIIESIMLINIVRPIDKAIKNKLVIWFSQFIEWLEASNHWAKISQSNNNIIASCYVSIVEMARFTGNKRLVKQISKTYARRIINVQISDDGRQPAELNRTIAFGYSVANLNSIVDFALIMEQCGMSFYKKNQKKIDSAFDYLLQFVDNHDKFPYKQEAPWGYYENKLKMNHKRLNRMKSHKRGVKKSQVIYSDDNIVDVLNYVF